MINARGLELLKGFEGLRLTSYQDVGGIWTIGYGSTKGVREGVTITEDEAEYRLEQDLENTEISVKHVLYGGTELNENQYAAFCLFAFNVRGWASAPLTSFVKAGDVLNARAHWLLYDKVTVGGVKKRVLGLLTRRIAELKLYLSPVG